MKQSEFSEQIINPNGRGGKRRGAGRKRRVDEGAHSARPVINGRKHPLHITVRLRDGLPNLRNRKTLKHLQFFMAKAQKFGLRINHFSALKNHIHMIAEANDIESLQSGMKSFNGRLGRWLRKQTNLSNIGKRKLNQRYPRGLFKGRYHIKVLTNPRQMRNALKYVLLNASKHFRKCPYIDQFSSAAYFKKWPELLRKQFHGLIRAQVLSLQEVQKTRGKSGDVRRSDAEGKNEIAYALASPATWLCASGWQRGYEVKNLR